MRRPWAQSAQYEQGGKHITTNTFSILVKYILAKMYFTKT